MNFTIDELCKSSTAQRLGIDNTPSKEVVENLNTLISTVLQPIRDEYKKPIHITSGYRCPKLNKAVGSKSTSQHIKGEASDINLGIAENKVLFNLIKKMIADKKITVGQLINEKNFSWIHVSTGTKNQILYL